MEQDILSEYWYWILNAAVKADSELSRSWLQGLKEAVNQDSLAVSKERRNVFEEERQKRGLTTYEEKFAWWINKRVEELKLERLEKNADSQNHGVAQPQPSDILPSADSQTLPQEDSVSNQHEAAPTAPPAISTNSNSNCSDLPGAISQVSPARNQHAPSPPAILPPSTSPLTSECSDDKHPDLPAVIPQAGPEHVSPPSPTSSPFPSSPPTASSKHRLLKSTLGPSGGRRGFVGLCKRLGNPTKARFR